MSQATVTAEHVATEARDRPPAGVVGPWAWLRANLLGSWWSTAITLLLGYVIVRILFSLFEWGVVNAVWTVPYGPTGIPDTSVCQNAKGYGACWAVLGDKYRLILFGRYPFDQQWRPAIVVLLFIGLFVVSGMRRFWRKELVLIWIATLVAVGVLMWGGVFGLPEVTEDYWGGLPITLILATFGLAFSFP
ncbi:MAG: ral L-amino acid transport system permease protein, partial [Acetobacteraceae bacterium]|nr:ral L-amino acid transport system permease protein [Acetobacteraceae bacterium]